MSEIFKDAFNAAYRTSYVAMTEKDLTIIDQVGEISERINAIDGFSCDVSRAYLYRNRISFSFDIGFDNRRTEFSLEVDKGDYQKSKPKFFISKDIMESEEVYLDTDANIQALLLNVLSLLGTKVAKDQMNKDIGDALSRQRLMKIMPALVGPLPKP